MNACGVPLAPEMDCDGWTVNGMAGDSASPPDMIAARRSRPRARPGTVAIRR
ncbi:MAG TPA: hypothetical protein VFK57_21520 [Vicinamibacterales bacterium]|nr:hypothetical protein [Vicinamibacterales bacterium]